MVGLKLTLQVFFTITAKLYYFTVILFPLYTNFRAPVQPLPAYFTVHILILLTMHAVDFLTTFQFTF